MVVNGKSDSNTNLVEAMELTALDEEKNRPKFHTSSMWLSEQKSCKSFTQPNVNRNHQIHFLKICFPKLDQLETIAIKLGHSINF